MTKLTQTVFFNSPPAVIYHTYLDQKLHTEFTQASAEIDPTVNGKYSVWDGYATGIFRELIPNEKIIQTWRASDWPQEIVSLVEISLFPHNSGTKLVITHTNIPEDQKEDIAQGWQDYYWEPLQKFLSAA